MKKTLQKKTTVTDCVPHWCSPTSSRRQEIPYAVKVERRTKKPDSIQRRFNEYEHYSCHAKKAGEMQSQMRHRAVKISFNAYVFKAPWHGSPIAGGVAKKRCVDAAKTNQITESIPLYAFMLRLPTPSAATTLSARTTAAPKSVAPYQPRSMNAPNKIGDRAKPTSSPEYTMP